MPNQSEALLALEKKFWNSLVDQDAQTAIDLLSEPALMVSEHGAMKFDHDKYRQMAEKGAMVLKSYELGNVDVIFPSDGVAILTYQVKQKMAKRGESDGTEQLMNDSSTWLRDGGNWKCVMHTETPASTYR